MITSGKHVDLINEKIGILKNEINQAGKLGLLNIHKQCENLIKNLLNLSYGLNLTNLNEPVSNFPGIDIGDKANGIAFQVTSEKTSEKVDETLAKIIRHKHYTTFPTMKIFMLTAKQGKYTLNTNINGLFAFDASDNVMDLDDWLKKIQHLDVGRLQKIVDIIEAELPYTIQKLKGEEDKAVAKAKTLIDIDASLRISKMPFFHHSAIRLRPLGKSFSTPLLYQALDEFYQGMKKSNLYLFNPVYKRGQTAQQIDFYDKLANGNVINYFTEGALRIQANNITLERATFSSQLTELTRLIIEANAITTLLICLRQLYGRQPMQVELDVDITSNGKLYYMSQNSPLHVHSYFSSPVLNPSPLSFSKIVHNVANETLNDIYQDILHGFVTEGQPGYFFDPFLKLNEVEQNQRNEWFRNNFAPTVKEIDD
jgi:hypothetical protein